MIKKRLARWVFGSTFFPDGARSGHRDGRGGSGRPHEEWQAVVGKAMAAGLAMGLSALGAGYAQAKIGSAGAGTLAERPEVSIWIITLQALPEVIVLLGFVSAILISG